MITSEAQIVERVCLYITIFLQEKGAYLKVGIQEKMEKEKTIIIYIGEIGELMIGMNLTVMA